MNPPPLPTQSSNAHPKWLPLYVVVSSACLLLLFCALMFRHPDSPGTPASLTESVQDVKLRTAQIEKQRAIARVEGLEGQLAILNQSLAAAEAERNAFNSKMQDYAMDHKAAIAALGITVAGAGIAMDDTHQFSDDQKTVATVGAVVAGLYAIANHEECVEVADRMAKAVVMQKGYAERITKTRAQIGALQTEVEAAKAELK